MEKDACVPTSKFPRKLTLRQRMAAATGLVAKSSRGPTRVARFSSPTTGVFGLEILSSPVPRIWPFAASVTILEGFEDFFRFVQTSRLRSPFPNCQDGAKNAGKRSDRQADRRSGPGKSESSSWPGLGQQRSQEHGLLQGTYILHQK